MGFPGGPGGKQPACQCRRHKDSGSIPGLGRSRGGEYGNPLPCFHLENPLDKGYSPWGCKESNTTEMT